MPAVPRTALPQASKREKFQQDLVARTKAEGNALFKAKSYAAAITKYGDALRFDNSNHILFSNRAMAHIKLKQWDEASLDCTKAIALDPTFPKGAASSRVHPCSSCSYSCCWPTPPSISVPVAVYHSWHCHCLSHCFLSKNMW